jgi:hypothetical protein
MKQETFNIYKQKYDVPSEALKQIGGGRLKGMSDINPQWRIDSLTEMFGICGFGWYYEVTKQWLEKGDGNNICAFVNVNLYFKFKDEWSKPVFGSGGSGFVVLETKGVYTSDECFKMATTDALSVACKMLGIGGSIYSRTKYDSEGNKIPLNDKPNDQKNTPNQQPTDDRKWLNPNTNEWNEAIKFLQSSGDIGKIEKKYRLSISNKELLITSAV